MKSSSTRAEIGANRRLFAQAGDPFRNCADDSAVCGSWRGFIDDTARGAYTSAKAICEPFSLSRAMRLVNALSTRTIDGWGIDA
jgi:hypothetical protein